ncbi:MAG TPA: hypothetical protein VH500_08080 [Nitrososphaeraceae archaeon]
MAFIHDMFEKSFHDSRNENEYKNKSREANDAIKYIVMSLGIIAIIATLGSVGNTFLRTASLGDSDQELDSVSLCKANALKYEQLGYYIGGASQFNAVISACSVGIGQ